MKEKHLEDFFIAENLYGTVIQDKLVVSHKHLKKDEFIGMHWHDYFEIEIVVSGSIEHICNNVRGIITRGDAFLMSYYDFHSIRCITDVEIINIRFYDNFLNKDITERISIGGGGFSCSFSETELLDIFASVNKILIEHSEQQLFKEIMVQNILSEIVIKIIRKSKVDASNDVPSMVQKAIRHIYRNFRTDISVESVAEQVNATPNYFGSVFKKNVGVSFNEYINKIRLKYACNLLEISDLTIKEIAFSSGYNSVEYFLYVFRKNLNATPNTYRKCKMIH